MNKEEYIVTRINKLIMQHMEDKFPDATCQEANKALFKLLEEVRETIIYPMAGKYGAFSWPKPIATRKQKEACDG